MYSFIIWRNKRKQKSQLYKEEANKVIILYIISVIEALFLYFYKNIPEKIEKIEYKVIQELLKKLKYTKGNEKVVLAVEVKCEKKKKKKNMNLWFTL